MLVSVRALWRPMVSFFSFLCMYRLWFSFRRQKKMINNNAMPQNGNLGKKGKERNSYNKQTAPF